MSSDIEKKEGKKAGWKDLPIGAVLKAGSAFAYKTGGWRVFRPVWHKDKCIHCLQCWMVCPDFSVIAKEEKFSGFDYEHCKGCGLCSYICPVKGKAITMVKEAELSVSEKTDVELRSGA